MLVTRFLSVLLEHELHLTPLGVQYYLKVEEILPLLMLMAGFLVGLTLRKTSMPLAAFLLIL